MKKEMREWDFTDFLLDDTFVDHITGKAPFTGYIKQLKENYPEKVEDIDLAIKVLKDIRNKTDECTYRKKQEIWDKITERHAYARRMAFLRIAAGFLLLIGVGATSYYFLNKESNIEQFAGANNLNDEQAGLVLSDGRQVDISDNQSSISYSADGTNVGINSDSKITQDVSVEAYNQLKVPYGKNSSLSLSDGTKVWLISGSRLVYPPVFTGKTREVYLEGEGYFEVTTNAEKPFIVKTGKFKVKAYGTKFDVRAYSDENFYSAILLEGKVGLSGAKKLFEGETLLKPNQQGTFNLDNEGFDVKKVEYAQNYIAWIHGHLNFDYEKLDQLLARVARFYNVKIDLHATLPSLAISGKLDLKEDPERVLKGIAVIAKLKLSKEEDKFVLYGQ